MYPFMCFEPIVITYIHCTGIKSAQHVAYTRTVKCYYHQFYSTLKKNYINIKGKPGKVK